MSMQSVSPHIKRQYAADERRRALLETRESLSEPPIDFVGWALDGIRWQGHETVLDVGCGYGSHYDKLLLRYPEIKYYGLDIAPVILQNHPAREQGQLVTADAQQLPYPDGTFDVVMANNLLYHVDDVEQSINEFKRVLKPDGALMVTTLSHANLSELRMLLRKAVVLLAQSPPSTVRMAETVSDSFSLEEGTHILARHFSGISRFEMPSTLVFRDIDTLMSYLSNIQTLMTMTLPTGVMWDDVMSLLQQMAGQMIQQYHELKFTRINGVLVATNSGDFMRDFVEIHARTRQA
jgi:ubiquinone/menaquinone biosynthesis C-methylase UbiE